MNDDSIVAAIAPAIQRYLYGDLHPRLHTTTRAPMNGEVNFTSVWEEGRS